MMPKPRIACIRKGGSHARDTRHTCPLQVRLAWRVEVLHAESALRLSFDGKQTTLLKRVVQSVCVYAYTSIERGPSAANSVFVNATLASSTRVNRPRRRSLDDLPENDNCQADAIIISNPHVKLAWPTMLINR